MKTTTRLHKLIYLSIATMLVACAQPPLSSSRVTYQANSVQALKNYAGNVSRGFKSTPSNTRRAFGDSTMSSEQPYQGYLMRQDQHQQVSDCLAAVNSNTPNCGSLNAVAGTLARCLNQIITYRNPILSYSYRQLPNDGQNLWAYLLNWRRPTTYDSFSGGDFNILSQFASQGFTSQDWQ